MAFERGFLGGRELQPIGEEKILMRECPRCRCFAKRVVTYHRIGLLSVQHQELVLALADQYALTNLGDEAKPVWAARFIPVDGLSNRGRSGDKDTPACRRVSVLHRA